MEIGGIRIACVIAVEEELPNARGQPASATVPIIRTSQLEGVLTERL
ncbi:hypothetical protein ACIBKX_33340 [Streptomyces sp. NPDC050658]